MAMAVTMQQRPHRVLAPMSVFDPSDRLWTRFRSRGDAAALGKLFDRVAPRLIGLSRHLGARPEEAEDAVQATFLAAIEGAERFRAEARVEPWLTGILVRQLRTSWRKAGREPDVERLLAREPSTPPANAATKELEANLRQALAQLPATYAEPLERRLVRDESPAEIAAALGISSGAVHVRLHRGLKRLRKLLPVGLIGPALSRSSEVGDLSQVREVVVRAASNGATQVGSAIGIGVWIATATILGISVFAFDRFAFAEDAESAPVDLVLDLREAEPDAMVAGPARNDRSAVSPPAPSTRTVPIEGVASVNGEGALARGEIVAFRPGTLEVARVLGVVGEHGRFRIEAEPAVMDQIGVRGDGLVPWAMPITAACRHQEFGHNSSYARDGRGMDLGVILMHRGAAVAGQVVDANGQPVSGAQLLSYRANLKRPATNDRVLGHSDPDGAFDLGPSLAWLGAHHLLMAIAPDGRMGTSLVAAPEGRTHIDDVRIQLAPTVPLHVRVVDPGGLPIEGARVTIEPAVEPWTPGAWQHTVASHTDFDLTRPHAPVLLEHWTRVSDATGDVIFDAAPFVEGVQVKIDDTRLGRLWVMAHADGYAVPEPVAILTWPTGLIPPPVWPERGTAASPHVVVMEPKSAPIEPEASPPTDPQFDAAPLRLRLVRPDGTPAADWYVGVARGERSLGHAFTDAEGLWIETKDADLGEWLVRAWPPRAREDFWFSHRTPPSVEMRVRGGETVRTVHVPDPIYPPSGNVRVALTDGDGGSVDALNFKLMPRAATLGRTVPEGVVAETSAGRLLLKHAPPGLWTLTVEVRGHPARSIDVSIRDGETTDVELAFD